MHAPLPPSAEPPPKHRPPRLKRKKPAWVQVPQSIAARAVMSVPLLMGVSSALAGARAVGRWSPRLVPKHFERALQNLREAFPTWDEDRVYEYAIHSYQHLAMLGVEIAFVPRLITQEGFARHLIFNDISAALKPLLAKEPVILITGHVGNWELIGYAISMLGFPMQAVYRPLDLDPLDQWLRGTRERRGLTLLSKFGAVRSVPLALENGFPVGMVADQSGGDRGLFTPFFGRLTSTYKSIGLLAMQYGCTLACGMARRLPLNEPTPPGPWTDTPARGRPFTSSGEYPSLRYSVEVTDIFGPKDWNTQPDPLFYLTARYRRAIETMVRKAPEQYFWMHRVWRSRPAHERLGKPFPALLREKLRALPWLTDDDVAALEDRSRRDALDVKKPR